MDRVKVTQDNIWKLEKCLFAITTKNCCFKLESRLNRFFTKCFACEIVNDDNWRTECRIGTTVPYRAIE